MADAKHRHIPVVEWISGLISLAIVLGTIGLLALDALRSRSAPPALTVKVERVRGVQGSYVVDVVVENASRRAAADVHIAGSARSIDGRGREATARVDYVPGLSSRGASLVFGFDPGSHLEVRIAGYAVP